MLYMVIEHFRNQDPAPVYRRFADRGRLAPDGLRYISSWVDAGLGRCFQVMEASERGLLDQWMAHWGDLVEFEVYPVITSQEAKERVLGVGPLEGGASSAGPERLPRDSDEPGAAPESI